MHKVTCILRNTLKKFNNYILKQNPGQSHQTLLPLSPPLSPSPLIVVRKIWATQDQRLSEDTVRYISCSHIKVRHYWSQALPQGEGQRLCFVKWLHLITRPLDNSLTRTLGSNAVLSPVNHDQYPGSVICPHSRDASPRGFGLGPWYVS